MDANLQALRPGEDWSGSEELRGRPGDWVSATAPAPSRTSPSSTRSPTSSPSRTAAPGWTTSTSTRSPASSATRRAVDARTLQELERALRDSGYLKRGSDGELRLSPKAMRQLGKALLRDVAEPDERPLQGARETRTTGLAGEPSGRDPAVGVRRHRAVGRAAHDHQRRAPRDGRRAGARAGAASRSTTSRSVETEARTQAAVALLVDTSFSMAMDGRWVPMKRTALALHQLIAVPLPRRRPPADRLRPARAGDGDRGADRPRRALGQGHQPPPRAAAGQPVLPQAPQRPAGAAGRHRRRADRAPRARRRGLVLLPAAPADDRPLRARARQRRAGWARRRRSSASARTPAWRASSTRWPAGSTGGW